MGDQPHDQRRRLPANAAETVELAHRASSTEDKGRLLAMAEAWLNLAARAHQVARKQPRKLREHPLLRAKLGRPQPETS
jgi:hypothetical protein